MRVLMVFIMFLFIISVSCSRNDAVGNKVDGKDSCFKVSNKETICLDMYQNLDTSKISLFGKNKKTLIVFKGWSMSGTTIVDEENLNKNEILQALRDYTIIVQYVDDKGIFKEKDSSTIGEANMLYQKIHFGITSQPYYVVFSNGKKQCEASYFGNDKEKIIHFLKTYEVQ